MPLNDVPGRVTRYTDWACAGGVPFAAVPHYDALVSGDEIDGGGTYELTVDEATGRDIATGEVHRVVDPAGIVREYRITGRSISESSSAPTRVTITGEPPTLDLADVGPILERSGAVPVLAFGADVRVSTWIDLVLDELVLRGQTWWAAGTIDDDAFTPLVAPATGWTPLQLLRALQEERGLELRVRRDGDTRFLIDLVRSIGDGTPPVVVRWGRNLRARTTDSNVGERATAILVQGATDNNSVRAADIGEAAWRIAGIVGTTPAWLQLEDVQGQEGPIAFDGQLADVGVHVMQNDGTCTAVDDARVSDQAIKVGDGALFSVGEFVQFVATSTAQRMIELSVPQVRRIARTSVVETARFERNLIANAPLNDWVDPETLAGGWSLVGACRVARYNRPELASAQAYQSMVSHASGATSLTLNTAPFTRVYGGEALRTLVGSPSVSCRVVGTVYQSDGSGDVTVPCTALNATLAAGRFLQLSHIGEATPEGPIRPFDSTLPDEPRVPNVNSFGLRFTSGASNVEWPPLVSQDQLRTPSFYVHTHGGTQQVNVSVGFTITNSFTTVPVGNLVSPYGPGDTTDDPANIGPTGRRLPALMILDMTATPVRLAYAVVRGVLPLNKSVLHETVELAATIDADMPVAIGLVPPSWGPPYNRAMFALARWINVWLGTAQGVPPIIGSWGTQLWQRANRELLARNSDARTVEVSFFDLSRAAGYTVTAEMIGLGTRLDLGDGGVYPRVVGLRLDSVAPDNSRVVLDARSSRLTRFLAERL